MPKQVNLIVQINIHDNIEVYRPHTSKYFSTIISGKNININSLDYKIMENKCNK